MRNSSKKMDVLYTACGRKHVLIFMFVAILWALFSAVQTFLPAAFAILSQVCISSILVMLALRLAELMKRVIIPDSLIDSSDKAVLVTGCSSGFGFQLVQRLDRLGFKVYAACRITTDDRAANLIKACSANVKLIQMDVTREDEIGKAVAVVTSDLGNRRLWALVCNAGIFSTSGFDWGSAGVSEYTRIMDTNAFGAVRVAKAFTPILRKTANSRIVLTSSTSGFLPCPSLAAYSMSKHALRGFGKALRIELMPFNVHVSMIEPDFYGTPLIDPVKANEQLDQQWKQTPDEIRESYNESQRESVITCSKSLMSVYHEDAGEVVDRLVTAVSSSRQPDHYYRVCSFAESIAFYLNELLPSELVEDYWSSSMISMSCRMLINTNKVTETLYRLMVRR